MYCTVESLTEQNMAIARTVAIAKMHTTNSIWFLNPSIFSNHVYYLEIYKHGSHLKNAVWPYFHGCSNLTDPID